MKPKITKMTVFQACAKENYLRWMMSQREKLHRLLGKEIKYLLRILSIWPMKIRQMSWRLVMTHQDHSKSWQIKMAWSRRYQRTWLLRVRISCPASRPATTRCHTPTWHPRNARPSLDLTTLTGPLPWPIPLCITGVGWSPWPQWRPTAAIPSTSLRSLYIRLTRASSRKTICSNKRIVYELTAKLDAI